MIGARLSRADARVDQALAAALVHDLGHGPFSHAFEKIGERFHLKMANHEAVSDVLIRDSEVGEELRAMGSGFANDVADMVSGSGTPNIYTAVVSSQFDADRLDYMRRDRLMTGTQHAAIDFEWLMENLEVGEVERNVGETRLTPVQTLSSVGKRSSLRKPTCSDSFSSRRRASALTESRNSKIFPICAPARSRIYSEAIESCIRTVHGAVPEKKIAVFKTMVREGLSHARQAGMATTPSIEQEVPILGKRIFIETTRRSGWGP